MKFFLENFHRSYISYLQNSKVFHCKQFAFYVPQFCTAMTCISHKHKYVDYGYKLLGHSALSKTCRGKY